MRLTILASLTLLCLAPVAVAQSSSEAIRAECALLEAAYAQTVKAVGQAPTSILVGCPGREGLVDDTTRRQDRQRFTAAKRTKVSATVKGYGRMGKIIFQRMIARGVPVEVALGMAETHLFATAAKSAQ